MPKRSSKKTEDPDHQQMARSVLDAVVPDAKPDDQEQQPPADEGENPAAVGKEG